MLYFVKKNEAMKLGTAGIGKKMLTHELKDILSIDALNLEQNFLLVRHLHIVQSQILMHVHYVL